MDEITLAQVLDLIDPNRSGWKWINLYEYGGDSIFSNMRTDAISLDLMKDKKVDSIGVDNGQISIYLTDESINKYWEKAE